MDAEKFGAFIQAQRKALKLTQAELAEKLHVTAKAVSRWERGIGFPDIKLLEPLAQALQVSLTELMQSQKLEADTVPKDAADAAVAGTLEIAQTKRRNVLCSPFWWTSYFLVFGVVVFFIAILTWFVDVLWIRAVGVYFSIICGCLAMGAVRHYLEHKQNPDIPVKHFGWRDGLWMGIVFLCGLVLILSFPIRSVFGQAACIVTRLASVLTLAALGIFRLHRYIKSMPDGR